MQKRRKLIQSLFLAPFIPTHAFAKENDSQKLNAANPLSRRFKLSLNAYSFNGPLTKKENYN